MIKVTPQEVAEIVNCNPMTVVRVLNGTRNADTPLGREIVRIYKLLKSNAQKQQREEAHLQADLKRNLPKIKKLR